MLVSRISVCAIPAQALPVAPGVKLTEVTPAFAGFEGYASRVVLPEDGGIVYMASGTGQACYDGRLWEAPDASGPARCVLHLGDHCQLSRENGVSTSAPELVAVLADGRIVLNLVCGDGFPNPDRSLGEAITGNVVVYDPSLSSFINLTGLSANSGRFASAIASFENEAALLIEVSDLATSDQPSPSDRGLSMTCVDVESGEGIPLERHARILEYYRLRSGSTVRCDSEGGRTDGSQADWRIQTPYAAQTYSGPVAQECLRVFLVDLAGRYVVVGDSARGTWWGDLGEGQFARLSEHTAIDVDPEAARVVLRTRQPLPAGHRYWILDLVDLPRTLRTQGLAAAPPTPHLRVRNERR